jgi:hypothetical protein
MKLETLRKKYPVFVYQRYSYKIAAGDLRITFQFKAEPDLFFHPKIVIKNVSEELLREIDKKALNNLIFHLGLIEIPSYWKAACSPEIIIKAGALDKNQVAWWKKLILEGMGQFFYENQINWKTPDFLKITSNPGIAAQALGLFEGELKDRTLVPFSGGKDSIVTLEKLLERNDDPVLFMINPSKATKRAAVISGVKKQAILKREIDQNLIVVNEQGYLNGHTPFTAVLSFTALLSAVLFDCQNIAFSNEKSADEGNVEYLGKIINHQWAKSSTFEKMFKEYAKKYLVKNINYSSFLRKYSELEIAKMFVQYPKYFSAFSSCNKGLKTGVKWCCDCPKCLFTYLMLSPYLTEKQLVKIFGKNLLKEKKMWPLLKKLTGESGQKPFECVGTYQESKLALELNKKKRSI